MQDIGEVCAQTTPSIHTESCCLLGLNVPDVHSTGISPFTFLMLNVNLDAEWKLLIWQCCVLKELQDLERR